MGLVLNHEHNLTSFATLIFDYASELQLTYSFEIGLILYPNMNDVSKIGSFVDLEYNQRQFQS